MAPSVKFTQGQIVDAALRVTRERGIEALTARALAAELGASTRPMFTYFSSVDELKQAVYDAAKDEYASYVERGLSAPIPFLGIGQQIIGFAREEPALYRLLFIERPPHAHGGAMDALALSQDLARESIMRTYAMDAHDADCYFRDLWLIAYSFATMIATGDGAFSDEQISSIFTEVSLSVCKAYKDIPGLPRGEFDRDALFRGLTGSASPRAN